MKPLTIAIHASTLTGWGGGIDFLRMLLQALVVCKNKKEIKIYLMIPYTYAWDSCWKRFIKHIVDKCFYRSGFDSYWGTVALDVNDVLREFEKSFFINFYLPHEYDNILKKIGVDVILPIGPSSSNFLSKIPSIGYIFDFQHKYYPQFFSVKEYTARELSFAQLLLSVPALIVHSLQVKKDIERFYPSLTCCIFDLPFCAIPLREWFSEKILSEPFEVLRVRYKLPKKYFVMCNQFWVHKDHITAFDALHRISDNNIHIVCTGKTSDYRIPDYFKQLQAHIDNLGLTQRIHFLGYIPKMYQIAIMRNSLALIQPTLFEGSPGGAAVEDAVALGVPVVLSDISVNNAVEGDNIIFFIAHNADDLALKMQVMLEQKIQRPSNVILLDQAGRRVERFSSRLFEAIEYVLNK
jgi:glycosyltransferase involved in cell wall biosynthesis